MRRVSLLGTIKAGDGARTGLRGTACPSLPPRASRPTRRHQRLNAAVSTTLPPEVEKKQRKAVIRRANVRVGLSARYRGRG